MNHFLTLTGREKRICRMLAEGKEYPEIAAVFECSVGSIHTAVGRAMRREGCTNSIHLVARYLEEYCGLLDPIPDYLCGKAA